MFSIQSSTGLYKELYDIGSTSQKYTKYTYTKSHKSFTVNFDYITGKITDIVDENGNKALFYYVNDLLYWNALVTSYVDFYEPIIKGLENTGNYESVVTINGDPNQTISFEQDVNVSGENG